MITLHEVVANGKLVYRGPNALVAIMTRVHHEAKGEVVTMSSDLPHTGQPLGFDPEPAPKPKKGTRAAE